MKNITICIWNINGLRAMLKKNKLYKLCKYDIICLQEVRCDFIPEELEDIFKGYNIYLNYGEKKGYSGTMTLTKKKPMNYKYMNKEGRIVETEFKNFKLVNCYFPQSNKRLEYKMKFCNCIKKMYQESSTPIIICGDINIAHTEMDIWNSNIKSGGFTKIEREWYSSMINDGFDDAFRYLHPIEHKYTWFDVRSKAKLSNRGWRIDTFFCKNVLLKKCKIIDIDGSDHLPVLLKCRCQL